MTFKVGDMVTIPKRTADTMSDAIALSSPNGHMSKRARETANERLRRALFGDGLQQAPVPQPTEREALLRQAADLRALAAHGVKPRAHIRRAEELERAATYAEMATLRHENAMLREQLRLANIDQANTEAEINDGKRVPSAEARRMLGEYLDWKKQKNLGAIGGKAHG